MEFHVCAHHFGHTRSESLRHENAIAFAGRRHHHESSLCRSSGTVIHRGVCGLKTGQLADHRLIFEDILQRALRDLRLIGGIGSIEFRPFKKMRNHRRRVMVVSTLSSEHCHLAVSGTESLEPLAQFKLRHALGEGIVLLEYHLCGNIGVEVIDTLDADTLQHEGYILRSMRDITVTHFRRVLYKLPHREAHPPLQHQ